jgi:hypothetical protein
MRHYYLAAFALLFLLAGCSRPAPEEELSTSEVMLAASDQPSVDQPSEAETMTVTAAHDAGLALILARDTCRVDKAAFDRMAGYFSASIGGDTQLKQAFVEGAQAAHAMHVESKSKGELEKLKTLACPGVQRVLASMRAVAQ